MTQNGGAKYLTLVLHISYKHSVEEMHVRSLRQPFMQCIPSVMKQGRHEKSTVLYGLADSIWSSSALARVADGDRPSITNDARHAVWMRLQR